MLYNLRIHVLTLWQQVCYTLYNITSAHLAFTTCTCTVCVHPSFVLYKIMSLMMYLAQNRCLIAQKMCCLKLSFQTSPVYSHYYCTQLIMAAKPLLSMTETAEIELQKKQERGNSLRIVTVGKGGVGKSSLIRDLLGPEAKQKPDVAGGWEPCTTTVQGYDIPVGKGVTVYVYDTRGVSDKGGWNQPPECETGNQPECETGNQPECEARNQPECYMDVDHGTTVIGEICNNDINGVLLVCIPMHERLDEDTKKFLKNLHQKYGSQHIWRYTVITLTKADGYNGGEWLESKNGTSLKSPF